MVLTNLSEISDAQKQELVASLATLVAGSEATAETISAVADASGNSLDASYAALFSSVVGLAGGIDKFCAPPPSSCHFPPQLATFISLPIVSLHAST